MNQKKKQKQKDPNYIHITKDSKNKARSEIENNVEMFAKILLDKSLPFSFGRRCTFILENLEYERRKESETLLLQNSNPNQ